MMSSTWALQARLSSGNLAREESSVLVAPEAGIRGGSCALRGPQSYPPGDGESVWNRALTPDIVRFVSILSRAGGLRATLPVTFPPNGEWLVRVIASNKQFVFGMYRRHMKTISYLGQIDKLFGVPATTRNWNTILAVLRLLKKGERKATDSPRTT